MEASPDLMSPQVVENQHLFRALKALLEDFRCELWEDELARRRLQQQYASDKAAWDVEWAVLKCRLEQVLATGVSHHLGWRYSGGWCPSPGERGAGS